MFDCNIVLLYAGRHSVLWTGEAQGRKLTYICTNVVYEENILSKIYT